MNGNAYMEKLHEFHFFFAPKVAYLLIPFSANFSRSPCCNHRTPSMVQTVVQAPTLCKVFTQHMLTRPLWSLRNLFFG